MRGLVKSFNAVVTADSFRQLLGLISQFYKVTERPGYEIEKNLKSVEISNGNNQILQQNFEFIRLLRANVYAHPPEDQDGPDRLLEVLDALVFKLIDLGCSSKLMPSEAAIKYAAALLPETQQVPQGCCPARKPSSKACSAPPSKPTPIPFNRLPVELATSGKLDKEKSDLLKDCITAIQNFFLVPESGAESGDITMTQYMDAPIAQIEEWRSHQNNKLECGIDNCAIKCLDLLQPGVPWEIVQKLLEILDFFDECSLQQKRFNLRLNL